MSHFLINRFLKGGSSLNTSLEPNCLAGTSSDRAFKGRTISKAPCLLDQVLSHLIDLYINISYEYENENE